MNWEKQYINYQAFCSVAVELIWKEVWYAGEAFLWKVAVQNFPLFFNTSHHLLFRLAEVWNAKSGKEWPFQCFLSTTSIFVTIWFSSTTILSNSVQIWERNLNIKPSLSMVLPSFKLVQSLIVASELLGSLRTLLRTSAMSTVDGIGGIPFQSLE